jgi:chain length determinant protein tyrosine kinase EpsG
MRTLKLSERTEGIQGLNIGNILIRAGRLKIPDLNRIIALQEKESILFGEAAVALGILTEEDVRWALACQYFYPSIDIDDNTLSREVLVVYDPFGSQVESFRSIRSGLIFCGVGKIIRSIALVSSGGGEGKSFIAANLAVVFAQLGSRTLLMDLNFRAPRVHDIFKMKNNAGASSLIIKRVLFDQAVQKTSIDSLEILTSGPKPPNPLELLSWSDTREMIEFLRGLYDIVIIDTPRFDGSADAMVIANICDAALPVLLKGKTSQSAFSQLKKQLDNAGVKILGAVMNEKQAGGR